MNNDHYHASPDFRFFHCKHGDFFLSKKQAAFMKCLCLRDEQRPFRVDEILNEANLDITENRIEKLFRSKRKQSPVIGTILKRHIHMSGVYFLDL